MSAEAVCRTCGRTFTPSASLQQRFPGWVPPSCPQCYRGGRGSGAAGGGAQTQPTPAQVLERYSDGPDSGVFTDGSAIPNPGPGGWGAVYVLEGEIVAEDSGGEPHTTNNRMELQALLAGVALVPDGTPATIHTDSNLAVRTLNEWAPGWARNGWRRRRGPVENLDLVRPLFERLQARPELTVVWIKAHAGQRWNEYADALATAAVEDVGASDAQG